MQYTIEQHRHTYAAWAASRASSQADFCRFSVRNGKRLIESLGFGDTITRASQLPTVATLEDTHREWRERVIELGDECTFGKHDEWQCQFTHGIAAKLINMYVKSVFVCGPEFDHPSVRAFHPPIDALLLDQLAREDECPERKKVWKAHKWTQLESDDYEEIIRCVGEFIRERSPGDSRLWRVEALWRGFQ